MTVRYHLPETRVRLSGVVDHVTTTFDPANPVTVSAPVSSAVEWLVVADQQATERLSLDGGLLEERLARISLTPDRRLAGAASSTTSQIGAVVKAGFRAMGALAAVGVLLDAAPSRQDPALIGYDLAHPEATKRLRDLRQQLARGRSRLDAARSTYFASDSPQDRQALYLDVRQLAQVVASTEQELDQVLASFAAWRASRTSTRAETVQTLLELRQLPRWDGQEIDWSVAAPTTAGTPDAITIWRRLGFIVARSGSAPDPTLQQPTGPGILVRLPRIETLAVLRRAESTTPRTAAAGKPAHREETVHVEETVQRWVLDDRCDTEFIMFDKKLLGEREVIVEFDADGVLRSVSKTGKDGVATTVTAVTEGALEALSSARTAIDTLDGFANHTDAVRRARLDTALAIAKAEVALAGLGATRAEAARVARLEQLAGMASAYGTITGAGPGAIDEFGPALGASPL